MNFCRLLGAVPALLVAITGPEHCSYAAQVFSVLDALPRERRCLARSFDILPVLPPCQPLRRLCVGLRNRISSYRIPAS